MQDYEIRVLNKSSAPSINYAATFFNDDAAPVRAISREDQTI